MPQPTQGRFEQLINLFLFVAHNLQPGTLRRLYRWRGPRMRLFGGKAFATFADATALMAEQHEKIDWFSGPVADRADYLTKSYVPFLLSGPNHTLRRREIVVRTAAAHAKLDDLEALLAEESDHERALTRFLYRHFGGIELSDEDVRAHLQFRDSARVLTLLPKWMRLTLLRRSHRRAQGFRSTMLRRMEAAGVQLADSYFDVIWFNSGTLGFYPEKAIETLRVRKDLGVIIEAELALPAGQRPKTRALIHEMLRLFTKIASTNYVREGQVQVAVIATAVVDPIRYARPYEVDLDRNHEDAVGFSGPAPDRGCPGARFAPDAMACVVADKIRRGALR